LDQLFASPELLDGDNKYFCSNCKKKVLAVKEQLISLLPSHYLILHLNRVKFNPKTLSTTKNFAHVLFPMQELDMGPYLVGEEGSQSPPPEIYDLMAVVLHHGRGMNEGHFTTYAYLKDQDEWLLYNDAKVESITVEQVSKASKEAYILFYEKRVQEKESN